MKSLICRVLRLIYPTTAVCMGCGAAVGLTQEWLCAECMERLTKAKLGACPDREMDGMAVAYHYRGAAGSIVRNMKFGGVSQLGSMMADAMCEAYQKIQPTGVQIVAAVPMHPKRLRKRGFNHSEVLAEAVAARLELPYENLLIRTRNTVQQARLADDARRKNMKGAFEAVKPLENRRILLVDDVYTTGETARECARTLRKAGAANVYFLAFAKGGK